MCVRYIDNVLNMPLYTRLYDWLTDLHYYSGETKTGRNIDRKQIWFHRTGTYFNPLWSERYDRWTAHEFDTVLDAVLDAIMTAIQCLPPTEAATYNSCLVNYYPTGQSFIPRHIDNIDSFGPAPTIINLSIGATRTFQLENPDMSVSNYTLRDNSVLIMEGPSVPHQLLRDPECLEPRWSLTFRHHRG